MGVCQGPGGHELIHGETEGPRPNRLYLRTAEWVRLVATASAIRTLGRLARERRKQPMPPMPEGWYPHELGDPFYELDWEFLHDHPVILQRHWETAWREGRV